MNIAGSLLFIVGFANKMSFKVTTVPELFENFSLGSCWLSIDDGLIWSFMAPMIIIVVVSFIE